MRHRCAVRQGAMETEGKGLTNRQADQMVNVIKRALEVDCVDYIKRRALLRLCCVW